MNKEVVQEEINGFNFVFEQRGGCSHGMKVKKRRPTPTPISIENLTIANLQTDSGKAYLEAANEQLKQVDWQQMFL